jgi:hypothetical protein
MRAVVLGLADVVRQAMDDHDISARFLHRELRDLVPLKEVSFRNYLQDLRDDGDIYGNVTRRGEGGASARKQRISTLSHILYALGVPKKHQVIKRIREHESGFTYPPQGGISHAAIIERLDAIRGTGPLLARLQERLQAASAADVRQVLAYVGRRLGY